MTAKTKKTPLDLAQGVLDDMIGLSTLSDARHMQDLLHHYTEEFEHPWTPLTTLEASCGVSYEGDKWPSNIIDELKSQTPAQEERLRQLYCSVADYSEAQWRVGYMVGLAMAQRLLGGAR